MAADAARFGYRLDRNKLRQVRRREGRYLLRTNLGADDPAQLWTYCLRLVAVEEAFKTLKGDLAIRPIFHHLEARIEAHIFLAFLAYRLRVTVDRRLHAPAPGLTPRRVLEKFATVRMIDVHVPTADGRELFLTRHTQPARDVLRAGVETARWITVDDTGARHKARNGVTTQIGNDHFAWFATTFSKSRLNFLSLRRGATPATLSSAR